MSIGPTGMIGSVAGSPLRRDKGLTSIELSKRRPTRLGRHIPARRRRMLPGSGRPRKTSRPRNAMPTVGAFGKQPRSRARSRRTRRLTTERPVKMRPGRSAAGST